jgi:CubicO group peptidase (beta-lactamase class C family)
MSIHKRCFLNHARAGNQLGRRLYYSLIRHTWPTFIVLVFFTGCQTISHREQIVPTAVVDTGFIRSWLICGDFPNPPHEGQTVYNHKPPCIGFQTDYLIKHGGEREIRPSAGLVHERPDGTSAAWFSHTTTNDIVDLEALFSSRPSTSNVVAYAYATLRAKKPGRTHLGVGSDDGVRIWLNGELVHENLVNRGVNKDQDRVAVELRKGDNTILVKIEQGHGGWGFALRCMTATEVAKIEGKAKVKKELKLLQDCTLRPEGKYDYMFTPKTFPKIVWDNPERVAQCIGEYKQTVRWFNSDLKEVAKPSGPGRYMAYVETTGAKGPTLRRALTLYCRPDDWHPWEDKIKGRLSYPPGSPIDKTAWKEQEDMIGKRIAQQFIQNLATEESGAILMAYLDEMQPLGRAARPTETPEIVNNDLQLSLKLKILAAEGKYPQLELPRKRKTKAPVLREGSAKEAGVRPDAAEKIRAVCRSWYENSGEPFVVLVARHGVIIIHEAFDDEKKGTVELDTPLYMASITKAMCGMMFAQFLDQGLIGLDDPVGKYLPDFPVEGDNAITLRQCFTHTTGLEGHYEWGGVHNPWLDNVILNGMGYLSPGKVHQYNGMGYDLAGKVMEVVSGKSILRLMHENFFEPLGVTNTDIDDMACATTSSAEDIARMGQLLLNRGSYGDTRFFSAQTFDDLLPTKLNQYYPSIEGTEWGIGLTWMRTKDPSRGKNGVPEDKTLLSKNTIGHGAASSATLRVDLDNGVVVSQVRNTAGKDYSKYSKYLVEFLQAIDQSIVDRKP